MLLANEAVVIPGQEAVYQFPLQGRKRNCVGRPMAK
jgi:hypothetical protein